MSQDNRFKKDQKFIDACLFRGAVLLLLIVMIIQGVLVFMPDWGARINTSLRLEGKPLHQEELLNPVGGLSTTPWAVINLKLQGYNSRPEVKVYIDHRETGCFIGQEMTLSVKHGNVISVENPKEELPVTIEISKMTDNILEPRIKTQIHGVGRLYFDPVVIR